MIIFSSVGIAPKLLQVIKCPGLGMKNMNDGVEVVHTYPFGMLSSFDMGRVDFLLRFQPSLDVARNRSDLGGGIAFADNKVICRGILQVPQVQKYNVFAFYIGDTVDDQVLEAVGYGFCLQGFFSAYQMSSV